MIDELLDLVDENNNVIAVMERSQVFAQGLKNFRLVIAHIRDVQDNHFIVRRSYNKAQYPGALCHVGGCVQSGETYEQAFLRELHEETGIDATKMNYSFLGYLNPFVDKSNGYAGVYELSLDNPIVHYNQDDFAEAFWLPLPRVRELITSGEVLTPNFPILYERFFI
jgi:8-oxo-dGTP pyrophosphatase MutT (NUDIX family)